MSAVYYFIGVSQDITYPIHNPTDNPGIISNNDNNQSPKKERKHNNQPKNSNSKTQAQAQSKPQRI